MTSGNRRRRWRLVNPVRFMPAECPSPPRDNVARSGTVDAVKELLQRLIAEARERAAWHEKHAARWARAYYTLGIPAAVLAGIAGATALASTTTRVVAGIIALTSAGISAAAIFLDSRNHQQHHRILAAKWSTLERDVNFTVMFDLSTVQTGVRRSIEHPSEDVRRLEEHMLQLQGCAKELQDREKELLTESARPFS
jgi:hypothetical protein